LNPGAKYGHVRLELAHGSFARGGKVPKSQDSSDSTGSQIHLFDTWKLFI